MSIHTTIKNNVQYILEQNFLNIHRVIERVFHILNDQCFGRHQAVFRQKNPNV